MARPSKLTLAFVSKRPAAAARVLETLEVDDAAAFVGSIPARYAVKLLAPLNSTLAADIVQRMSTASATAVIREMEFANAASILRRITRSHGVSILAELPDRRRREFETAMQFSADMVGARMSTDIITASREETVADALKRVRDDKEGTSSVVYVIDERHKWLGSVSLSVLCRQRPRTSLEHVLNKRCAPVAARAKVAQVTAVASWNEHQELPVVSRRGELIGVYFRQAAGEEGHAGAPDPATPNPSIGESLLKMMMASSADWTGPATAGDNNER